jgi:hypothetical protein
MHRVRQIQMSWLPLVPALYRVMRALTTGTSDVPTDAACADLGVVKRLVLPWTLMQQVRAVALY